LIFYQPCTAKGDSGVHIAGSICRDCQLLFPARATALEPCRRSTLPGDGGILCIHETVRKKFIGLTRTS